ncbi:uncharacterized protein LOC110923928 [Helianthus annuus]|uniref:uncharacterized protein LOC110923928 n=1 Tax=Helianthus annuus TaxID=4232 RepID=UPI000B9008AC|nr:uncharacterized protein LOC110923928 [Helianthus annuus]
MNFPDTWRKWIWGILTSARSSALVNGSPTYEFQYHRGLQQGDPLSPFLFLIGMEALSCMINCACDKSILKGIGTPNGGPVISRLFYADDALIIGDWSVSNVRNMTRILRCFFLVSGLQINYNKSKLFGVGVDHVAIEHFAEFIGCSSDSLPFSYLGLPVGANMSIISHWDPSSTRSTQGYPLGKPLHSRLEVVSPSLNRCWKLSQLISFHYTKLHPRSLINLRRRGGNFFGQATRKVISSVGSAGRKSPLFSRMGAWGLLHLGKQISRSSPSGGGVSKRSMRRFGEKSSWPFMGRVEHGQLFHTPNGFPELGVP